MAGYLSRNNSVINGAFKRLVASKDRVIEAGMKDLLEAAMLGALSLHDTTHWLHKSTENSYGCCLRHDGRAVAVKVNEGRHGGGRAREQLMAVSREVSQKGWVGILLASMEGDRPMYFSIDYEDWILLLTADDVRDNFKLFFNILSGPATKIPME